MAGAILCIGAHNALASVRIRERTEHRAFAVACLFIALYAVATAGLYSAATPLENHEINRRAWRPDKPTGLETRPTRGQWKRT